MRILPIFAAAGVLVALTYAGGCALDEIISVDVPPNTRQHFADNLSVDVPPRVTLRDARILRAEGDRKLRELVEGITADHKASNDTLDAEIADGSMIEGLVGSAVNTGIQASIPGLGAVPGGAILTTLLAGLGMWFVPRPGDGKRHKAAEDRGYDMGRDEAAALLGSN